MHVSLLLSVSVNDLVAQTELQHSVSPLSSLCYSLVFNIAVLCLVLLVRSVIFLPVNRLLLVFLCVLHVFLIRDIFAVVVGFDLGFLCCLSWLLCECVVLITNAIDCLETLTCDMTCYVSSEISNSTHYLL